MTYTSPFVYVRVLGHFGSGGTVSTEQWNVGLKIPMPLPGPSAASMAGFLTDIAPLIGTFHSSTALKAGTTCFIDQLTGAFVGTDGKYVGGGAQTTQVYTYGTKPQGNGAGTHPWSTAIVLSLRTPLSRGYASNGRVYWPNTALAIDISTGVWASASTLGVATAAKTMLDGINTATTTHLDGPRKISVMSNVGAGTTAPVTSVRVGGKPDRQERRERKLVESYSSSGLATTLQDLDDRLAERIGELPPLVRP